MANKLIEADTFPFEFLCPLAEKESWRKEIHRPIYHLHKWWAKRLGTVFRGAILGCLLEDDADLAAEFYKRRPASDTSIFDPFMGSGTTIGEAHKLGCVALGRDINPVAAEAVRVAMGAINREAVESAFATIAATVGARVSQLYCAQDERGNAVDVLYFFWVKQAPCPSCSIKVDLFSSRIFARNAYPDKKPEVQICCASCGAIFRAGNKHDDATCPECGFNFTPDAGAVIGRFATCTCGTRFKIAEAIRISGEPPTHRLYAKLVWTAEGDKQYLRATTADVAAYRAVEIQLTSEIEAGTIHLPLGTLAEGFNTKQAISYNYLTWKDFFNARQLLALGWLHTALARLPDENVRDLFLIIFSGVLEFNNLFASYKGEGTGAVRHMFAHHILKPERTPIEANVWGTAKSSGSFSTLFRNRFDRAWRYRMAPTEVSTGRPVQASSPFTGIISPWPADGRMRPRGVYLSCGSSDASDLQTGSVDHVVTDPPFFDNVHYSELADFFYAWHRLHRRGFVNDQLTTRHNKEAQDTDPRRFAAKLQAVFKECHRVLKADGMLVFSYHHSRPEGWSSVATAVYGADFYVVAAHPLKAEMSVAIPKNQAKEPIQLDILLVCRKKPSDSSNATKGDHRSSAADKVRRLQSIGMKLSKGDIRIIEQSTLLARLGPVSAETAVAALCTT